MRVLPVRRLHPAAASARLRLVHVARGSACDAAGLHLGAAEGGIRSRNPFGAMRVTWPVFSAFPCGLSGLQALHVPQQGGIWQLMQPHLMAVRRA